MKISENFLYAWGKMVSELDYDLEFQAADGMDDVLKDLGRGKDVEKDDFVDALKKSVDRIHEDDREDGELTMLLDDGRFGNEGTANFGLNDNSNPEIKAA